MSNEITERLDRLENHFKVYKSDMQDVKLGLQQIRDLLGGTALNGNKGFVNLMERVESKVDKMELEIASHSKDIDSIKFWGRGASGLMFACILVIINFIKDKL